MKVGICMAVDGPKTTDYKDIEMRLWPWAAPGSEGLALTETVVERSTDPAVPDRSVTGVTEPAIIPQFACEPNGTAVLVIPGGGYERLVIDKEGLDIARWLNQLGITAFVLKHRLPGEGHRDARYVPLQDAQRAMRLIRSRAAAWGINPDRLGVMGFSAGGHLAATLSTRYDCSTYAPVDEADTLSARPSFTMLVYPVISFAEGVLHKGSRSELLGEDWSEELSDFFSNELHVNENTPPAFIVHAHDDRVSPLNSVRYYTALKENNVPAELHIFMGGGHGFGIRYAKGAVARWTMLAEEWLTALK